VLRGAALADAYAAMDVFAFSSLSETQGLVLVEAMTAGCPVVALDAPGARDVVTDRLNGRLLGADTDVSGFAAALAEVADAAGSRTQAMRRAARETAAGYAIDKTVARTRAYYQHMLAGKSGHAAEADSLWMRARRSLAREMDILGNFAYAAADAILPDDDGKADKHG
jgi:1,2-diacylglycerol 3-alpha-glucosyltransferase